MKTTYGGAASSALSGLGSHDRTATDGPETALDNLKTRLAVSIEQASQIYSRIDGVLDRAFGASPSPGQAGGPAAVPCGRVAELREQLDQLGRILDATAGAVERLHTLA